MRWLVLTWLVLAAISAPSARAQVEPIGAQPSPEGARALYVSSSVGDDANAGTSPGQPLRTLAAARARLRDGSADRLLLKCGDVWDEPLTNWRLGGLDHDAPMLIAPFGAGDHPPTIRAAHGYAFSRDPDAPDVSHLTIVGVRFETQDRDAGASAFWWLGAGSDLRIEDCAFVGGANGLVLQQGDTRLRDVQIRRCVFTDVASRYGRPHALYAWGVDGLRIEQCVLIGAPPGAPSPHTLISVGTDNTDVVVRRNLAVHAAHTAIRVASGGIIEGNVIARCPRAITLGSGPPDPVTHTLGVTGDVIDNVVFDCDEGVVIENIGVLGARVAGNVLIRGKRDAISLGEAPDPAPPPGVGRRDVHLAHNIIHAWDVGVRVRAAAPGQDASGCVIEANQISDCASALLDVNAPGVRLSANLLAWSDARAPVRLSGQPVTPADWFERTGDDAALWASPGYADPGRSLATFSASLGFAGTLDALLQRAAASDPDAPCSARAIAEYIRAGFRVSPAGRAQAR